jgi:putative NIF3 family GTP cyclohydrolase 1 type 2
MKAIQLYKKIEKDFIVSGLSDDWARYMESVQDFLSDNFKKRSMGLVCDFARDIMLFVHHPSIWDIRKAPEAFQQMDKKLLKKFRERRISIYNLHVPLDNFGEYSTGASLAKTLGFKVEKPFARYYGGKDGVICLTNLKNVQEVKKKLEAVLGHKASLYKYGTNKIKDGKIAIITGGGNNVEHLKEVASEAVNTFITGITVINEYSKKAHDYAQKHRINIFGGTHYSTEKFACIAICEYFKKIGLPSKFIEDKPVLRDT